jgi:glycosyltransferase involved in cell wall biosynthesis
VFNGARYLSQCLDSLLAQTHRDLEILISDNASTDETGDICLAYCALDERVRYYRQPRNLGLAGNYRFVVEHARGELFKWAAYDDVCAPEFVEHCVAALDRSPHDVLAFPATRFIDDAGELLARPDFEVRWRNHPRALGRVDDILADRNRAFCKWQFGLVRRDALQRTGLIGNFDGSDLVFVLELALLGGFARVEEPLFYLRIHQGTSGIANPEPVDLARWLDPRRHVGYPLARTHVFVGYLDAVTTSPALALHEKIGALVLVGRWLVTNRQWRVIGGELKRRAVEWAIWPRKLLVRTRDPET